VAFASRPLDRRCVSPVRDSPRRDGKSILHS
jgi:hypothetical protein